jgi:hypothetical protein
MGIFDWLFGGEGEQYWPPHSPPPIPSSSGVGPTIDVEQAGPKTDDELSSAESQYESDRNRLGAEK